MSHTIKVIDHDGKEHQLDATVGFSIMEIIRDADRLDAIGAIGIARCFNYGGFKNRAIYDPDISIISHKNKTSYKNSKAPSFNHFYEKLLLLKDLMHTKTAKGLAEERHEFMINYIKQFKKEWHLEP